MVNTKDKALTLESAKYMYEQFTSRIDKMPNEYIWRKYESEPKIEETVLSDFTVSSNSNLVGGGSWSTVEYSSSINPYANVIELNDPTKLYVDSRDAVQCLIGNYFRYLDGNTYYKVPNDSRVTSHSGAYFDNVGLTEIVKLSISSFIEYKSSDNKNEYPLNGEYTDGYWYVYYKQLAQANDKSIDTYDATASPKDIVRGATAYVNGKKIVGIHDCEGGVDTYDATATESDIKEGETAYSNGKKVRGTLKYYSSSYDTNTAAAIEDDHGIGVEFITANNRIALGPKCNVRAIVTGTTKGFGLARPEDVVEGVTFTSDAGLKQTGTHVCSGGISTSDATATAEDIAKGETAYVNGQKITGSLTDNRGSFTAYSTTQENVSSVSTYTNNSTKKQFLEFSGKPLSEGIYDGNNSVSLFADFSRFGDATAADVAQGKTFTSVNGLKVSGTHVCEGGIDTSDATASATDITKGETAYVNGIKIVGTHECDGSFDFTGANIIETDVLNGKKAYNSNGELIVGTHVCEKDANGAVPAGLLDGTSVSPTLPDNLTSIRDYCFYDFDKLELSELPSGVESLGKYSFYNCKKVSFHSLPNGISILSSYAFYGCTNLQLSSLPEDLTGIQTYCFYGCTNMPLSTLPAGLLSIESNAFRECSSILLASLPGGITDIAERAFYRCIAMPLVSLPDGVTSIGAYAFYECNKLALTSLPQTLTSLNAFAFYGCKNIALSYLPDGLTTIGNNVFNGCENMPLETLPNNLKAISTDLFNGCKKLKITEIPATVTRIDSRGFKGCTSLTSITFLGTPSSIASNAFDGCTSLRTINVPWAEGDVSYAPWGATFATINYNYSA